MAFLLIQCSKLIPPGKHILWRNGKPVFMGEIGLPIEDVDYDKIQVNPVDYERIVAAFERASAALEDK
jgi:hypothetical protein